MALISLIGLILGFAPVMAQSQPPVHVIEIKGVINPLTMRYLQRALAEAEREGAGLLVIRLDTPGGLDTAMREMAQAMLGARVPVAVYVTRPPARGRPLPVGAPHGRIAHQPA